PGPAGATRDEVAVVVLRARHLERERLGWRRALLLDVGAVRGARAADERAEPAALRDERPLPALRADLALAGLGRCLLAREWPGLLVLGVERAREEPPVPAEPDDHRMAFRADLVGGLGREVAAAGGLADLVDTIAERRVERLEQRHPL